MKRSLLYAFMVVACTSSIAFAQADKSKRPSPPKVAEGTIDGIKIKVDYSAPSAKGRKIIGGIDPYGKVWRTGANEPTIFVIDQNAKIEGKALAAGAYDLFSIPGETEWVIIFQKKGSNKWGAFDYDEKKDVLRVKVIGGKTAAFVETFTFAIENGQVVFTLENTQVGFKVTKG